jgi:hypothetical protein
MSGAEKESGREKAIAILLKQIACFFFSFNLVRSEPQQTLKASLNALKTNQKKVRSSNQVVPVSHTGFPLTISLFGGSGHGNCNASKTPSSLSPAIVLSPFSSPWLYFNLNPFEMA